MQQLPSPGPETFDARYRRDCVVPIRHDDRIIATLAARGCEQPLIRALRLAQACHSIAVANDVRMLSSELLEVLEDLGITTHDLTPQNVARV